MLDFEGIFNQDTWIIEEEKRQPYIRDQLLKIFRKEFFLCVIFNPTVVYFLYPGGLRGTALAFLALMSLLALYCYFSIYYEENSPNKHALTHLYSVFHLLCALIVYYRTRHSNIAFTLAFLVAIPSRFAFVVPSRATLIWSIVCFFATFISHQLLVFNSDCPIISNSMQNTIIAVLTTECVISYLINYCDYTEFNQTYIQQIITDAKNEWDAQQTLLFEKICEQYSNNIACKKFSTELHVGINFHKENRLF